MIDIKPNIIFMHSQYLIIYLILILFSCHSNDNNQSKEIPPKPPIDKIPHEGYYYADTVKLSGLITKKQYYTRPGFGLYPATDPKITFYFLNLQDSITVYGDNHDFKQWQPSGKVKINNFQLMDLSFKIDFENYLDKQATITGTFFPANTGDHHTDLLIEVKNIQLNSEPTITSETNNNYKEQIVKLIKTSNYKNPITNNFDTWIDTKNDSLILVKLFIKNEEGHEHVVGWIKLDLINDRLLDITYNPDTPKVLFFDKKLFELIKNENK